ncbi:MAG: hypothetical protein COA43_08230 [Robiginitomaculum sp.]|nr:MAG: hypothetical protein COA43_08230 [Robiginitomaculum sp.]
MKITKQILLMTFASVFTFAGCETTQAASNNETSNTYAKTDHKSHMSKGDAVKGKHAKKDYSKKKKSHGGGHGKSNFYDSYDANNDKSVSVAEYRAARNKGYDARDGNADGNVLADEYVAEYEARLEKDLATRRDRQLKQAYVRFGILDKDKNGIISREEFQASGQRMFKRLDSNNDGVVDSKDEATKY